MIDPRTKKKSSNLNDGQTSSSTAVLLSRVYEHTTVLTAVETKNVCLYRSEEENLRKILFNQKKKS